MTRQLLAFLIGLFPFVGFSQVFLLQEDFSNGIPSGWQVVDADGHIPQSTVSQFTSAWIPYVENGDSCVASTSYYETADQSADYLILPKQSLLSFSKLSWEVRSVDASFPDGYYVLLSTTDSSLTSFTDTLYSAAAAYFQWQRFSVHLDTMGFANQDVFIAFRNNTTDGFILELDDIWLEASDFASIERDSDIEFNLFPNPCASTLNIACSAPFELQINDLLGRSWLRTNETSIDVSQLPSGRYFATILTEEGLKTLPFIKQ